MEFYQQLAAKAQTETMQFMSSHSKAILSYHNAAHTQNVAKMVAVICDDEKLDERSKALETVAAWFHDVGYFMGINSGHESASAAQAEQFLKTQSVSDTDIDFVKKCILATQMPQTPQTLEEQIICDADLSHLASADFYDCTKRLRKEVEASKGEKISKLDWLERTLLFLQSHHYFTAYGQKVLEPQKAQNIHLLQQKIAEEKAKNAHDKKDDKDEKPSKGIETMFRITSSNNQKLSQMADNKAHILISVNSIILSAIISLLLRKLAEYEYLSIPTYIILSISIFSMIFSLLATRPHLPSGQFSKKDIDEKKVNLLFFGNFYKMSLAEYTAGMFSVMKDYDYLYQSLIKDVYSQGVVLSRKYKLLRISYNVFMYGMILSVLSFIVASILNSSQN